MAGHFTACRYIGLEYMKQSIVHYHNGTFHQIRLCDSNPVSTATDPVQHHNMEFAATTGYINIMKTVLTKIRPGTLPPVNMYPAKRYPDAGQWAVAYQATLRKLDIDLVVDLEEPLPLGADPLALIVSFFTSVPTTAKHSSEICSVLYEETSCHPECTTTPCRPNAHPRKRRLHDSYFQSQLHMTGSLFTWSSPMHMFTSHTCPSMPS